MKLTLLAALVLSDILYDSPFVEESSLVARTTSRGPQLREHFSESLLRLTHGISALNCRPSWAVKSRFLDLLPSSENRMTLCLVQVIQGAAGESYLQTDTQFHKRCLCSCFGTHQASLSIRHSWRWSYVLDQACHQNIFTDPEIK